MFFQQCDSRRYIRVYKLYVELATDVAACHIGTCMGVVFWRQVIELIFRRKMSKLRNFYDEYYMAG